MTKTTSRARLERAVVNAALVWGYVDPDVSPSDFSSAPFRLLYEAAERVRRSGAKVDVVSVATSLRDRGLLKRIGGMAFMVETLNGDIDRPQPTAPPLQQ